MKRPMLYWVISFVLGEVLAGRIPKSGMAFIIILCSIFVISGRQQFIKKNRRLLFFGVLFFVLGFICTVFWNAKTEEIYAIDKYSPISFVGKITERNEKNGLYTYSVKCRKINNKKIHVGMILESDIELLPGSIIEGEGNRADFMNASNPGQYDEESYRKSGGYLIKFVNATYKNVHIPHVNLRYGLILVREKAEEVIDIYFDESHGSMAKAMLLGDKDGADKDIKALYQRNGIAHLLAISGLHIAMLGGSLYQLIRKITGKYYIAALIGALFIVLYGTMTGLSGSTIRAIIMLILAIGADVLGRKYDAVTGISIALLIMLVYNPPLVNQAGFLLSFCAVIGITCVYPVLEEYISFKIMPESPEKKFAATILKGLLVSLSVQIVSTPIILTFFYEIPLYSIFLNVIVVPLMSVLLGGLIGVEILGILVWILSYNDSCVFIIASKVLSFIASCFAWLSDIIFRFYEIICSWNELLPCHTICTGRPGILWTIVYYILLGAAIYMLYKKHRAGLIFLFLWGMMWSVFILPQNLKICMFDVGQGDGIFLSLPDKVNILIDGGSSSKKQIGTYILKNGIKYYGGSHISYSIITHSDSDHYSGVLELLECPDVKIDNLVLPYILNPDEAYMNLCKTAVEKGCNVIYLKSGDKMKFDDVTFVCLNPEKQRYDDKNSGSIVLWLKYGNFDMLFTGDIDSSIEKDIMDNEFLSKSIEEGNRLEVLKVAHHGSKSASSKQFLKKYKFDTALISVADKNSYGHPSPEVMNRLERYCERIYLTKESGAITIETDGRKYFINQFLHTQKKAIPD